MSMKEQIRNFSKIIYVGGELRVDVCMGLCMAALGGWWQKLLCAKLHDLQIAGPAVLHSMHASCTVWPPHAWQLHRMPAPCQLMTRT